MSTIMGVLRTRYARPEWEVQEEITLGARRLDAVAFGLWPSSGYALLGFEFKQSRADLLRELNNHQKSAHWFSVVDQFYFITTPGVMTPADLPAGCGWLEYTASDKLRLKAHALVRHDRTRDIPREVVARFLTRMGTRDAGDISVVRERMRNEIRTEMESDRVARGDPLARQLAEAHVALTELRAEKQAFEEILGVGRREWVGQPELLRACRLYVKADHTAELVRQANVLADRLQGAHNAVRHAVAEITAMPIEEPAHE